MRLNHVAAAGTRNTALKEELLTYKTKNNQKKQFDNLSNASKQHQVDNKNLKKQNISTLKENNTVLTDTGQTVHAINTNKKTTRKRPTNKVNIIFLDVVITVGEKLNTDAHPAEYGKLFPHKQTGFPQLAQLSN